MEKKIGKKSVIIYLEKMLPNAFQDGKKLSHQVYPKEHGQSRRMKNYENG
jgi:hypothetical protein